MKLAKILLSILLICLVINANPVKPPDYDPSKGPNEEGFSPVQKPVLEQHSATDSGKWVNFPEKEVEFGGRKVITEKEVEFRGGSNQDAVKPGLTGNELSDVAKKSLNGLKTRASKTTDILGNFVN